MKRIGAVLLVFFLFASLVACSASVKDREKEALSVVGGDKLIFSESMIGGGVYVHVVCKDNVPVLVSTGEGLFGGVSVFKTMILNPNEIACVKK